jgi:NAD(P)-dependent dehydrogenase (short-subunit alcohol dehydrogenase family)
MGRYDVTKAGIARRRASLAAEETKQGIRVNTVCPGYTPRAFHIRGGLPQGADLKTERRADPREPTAACLRPWRATAGGPDAPKTAPI